VGKPEGKRPLAGTRRRREDNIEVTFQEIGRGVGLMRLKIGTRGGNS
jgi:hypothetical protein